MKLSTRGRYGLRAMFDLALNYNKEYISLNSIAERQGISEGYLEQLIIPLKKAKLVKGARGSQGGYILSKAPSEITIGEVLRVLEGSLALVDCLRDDSKCKKIDRCVTRMIWKKMSDSLSKLVDSVTLEELVKDYRDKLPISDEFTCV